MNSISLFSINGLTTEQKLTMCEKMKGFGMFEPEVWTTTMVALQAVSSLAMLFIGYTIFYNPHLRTHPADLIGCIFMLFAFQCYMSLSLYTICPGPGEVVFAATVYFDTSEASLLRAMNTLTYSYLFFVYGALNMPPVLEICLLLDLTWTLKRPMSR